MEPGMRGSDVAIRPREGTSSGAAAREPLEERRGPTAASRPRYIPLGVVFPRTGGVNTPFARAFFRASQLSESAFRLGGSKTGSVRTPRLSGGARSSSDDEDNNVPDLEIIWIILVTFVPTAAQAAAGEAVLKGALTPTRAGVGASEGDESW
jgi:hypothetical protein